MDKLIVLAFCVVAVYFLNLRNNTEVTLLECSIPEENQAYFVGLEGDFNKIKKRVLSYKREDCKSTIITKAEWFEIKISLERSVQK
jgi:RNase P/RNase MRP subunit p29